MPAGVNPLPSATNQKIMEGMAHENHQLDTSIEIVTPENVSFRYHVAGPFRRLPAYLLDCFFQVVLWAAVSVMLSLAFSMVGLPSLGIGFSLVFLFVVSWFYGGLFEAYWNGQTPGKRMMRIRVISTDGQPINGLQAVLRNFLRAIDSLPFYQIGLFSSMANDRFQRLGDLASGTMVIVEEREWFRGIIRIDEPDVVRLAQRIPPSFQASPSLARTLAAYVQRRLAFPVMRRVEVARHLAEPLARRFGLPEGINPDHLLCAVYQRVFITDLPGEQEPASPFLVTEPSAAGAAAVVAEPGASPFGTAAVEGNKA